MRAAKWNAPLWLTLVFASFTSHAWTATEIKQGRTGSIKGEEHGPRAASIAATPKATTRTTILSATASYNDSNNDSRTIEADRRRFLTRCGSIAPFIASTSNPSIMNAMMKDPKTGISLPSPGEIEAAIPSYWSVVGHSNDIRKDDDDDDDNPFKDARKFTRLDSKPDSIFYEDPRFVEHVDEQAVQLMTNYVNKVVSEGRGSVLDLCSSWTSHADPSTVSKAALRRFSGLGMNEKELQANKVLTDYAVQDLNQNPKLPYADGSFDTVLCQLSIDYLTKPKEVVQEIARVLNSNGTVHILFSNRLFLSKAVGLWTGADDIDHAYIVGSYIHFGTNELTTIKATDLSARQGRDRRIIGDPMYVVTATKR